MSDGPPAESEELSLHGLSLRAAGVWEEAGPGSVIHLVGELGTGKTAFVKRLVQAAGGGEASSPTFALVLRYDTDQGPVFHADCYRLETPDEALDLDLFELGQRARLLLVEWPERGGDHVPPADLTLEFSHTRNPETRRVRVVT